MEALKVELRCRRWAVTALLLCLVMPATAAMAKNPLAKQAEEEMEFGFKAARRGYWQEALERFELADELTPRQPRILNNIAVALEANGRFDEARTTYETALALDPSSSALRKNFDRFKEFYATHVAVHEEDTDSVDVGSQDDEGDDDAQ
jgi:tetratricopeptide (TPR) repeat protein